MLQSEKIQNGVISAGKENILQVFNLSTADKL